MKGQKRSFRTAASLLGLRSALLALLSAFMAEGAAAQSQVEKNVVYGMYSGLALLMDVYHPDKPNGYGVIHVAGSAWHAPTGYGAAPLKESQIQFWGPTLLRAGYVVFTINHRAAPEFRYPAALEDVQRAVRFVRHNARRFGIDGRRIGGMGGSSGAHLLGLAAMLRASGIVGDSDPVNAEEATLQAVVLRAGPFDLRTMPVRENWVSFIGRPRRDAMDLYAAASPIAHVSPGAPPVLLIHGDADEVVPFDQSVAMEQALRAAGTQVTLIRIPGGEHREDFGADGQPRPNWPNYQAAMIAWLEEHLQSVPHASRQ